MYRGEDVGVHLTLNAEWETYRWGPITHSPSLLDGDGGFPRTLEDVWDHADLDEVRKECRAQIERAIFWGFDVTHLDSHMGTMQLRADFFDVYLELAVDFRLPLRMARRERRAHDRLPVPPRSPTRRASCSPTTSCTRTSGRGATIERTLFDLRPGVTEIYLHPAVDTDELRVSHPDWARRVEDHAFLTSDASLRDLIDRAGAILIGYRELRELQRRAPAAA